MRLWLTGENPKIDPANQRQLLVSWENVFVDCKDSDVKNVEIEIQTTRGENRKIPTGVKFSKKKAYVLADPCLQHKIYVTLERQKTTDVPVRSKVKIYNEVEYVREYEYYKTFYS